MTTDEKKIQKIRDVLLTFPYIVDSYYSAFEDLKEIRPHRAFVNVRAEEQVVAFLDAALVKTTDYLDSICIRIEYNGIDCDAFKELNLDPLIKNVPLNALQAFGVPVLFSFLDNDRFRQIALNYEYIRKSLAKEVSLSDYKYIIVSSINYHIECDDFCLFEVFHDLSL